MKELETDVLNQTFIETYVNNENNKSYNFLKEVIQIKNDNKINKLIPKIPQYAQNLHPNVKIIMNRDIWYLVISMTQLCYE